MRKTLTIIGILISVSTYAQLDTVNMSITDFGVPSKRGYPDFVHHEMRKVNSAIKNIDSLNNFIDVTDSTIVVEGITYSDTYWDDLRVPLTNTRINPANSEPDFEDMGNGAFAWGFDADADSTHVLNFLAQLPHKYKEGTDIEAHIHWTPPTTNTGEVRWKLMYWLAAVNDTIVGPDSLYINDAGDGIAFKHQLAEFGTIAGDSLGISSMIIGKVSRVGADDSFTGSAYGLEIDFHYELDQPGSSSEYTK